MGLSACAETMIGIPNTLKGLSCGEQKRLAFASEVRQTFFEEHIDCIEEQILIFFAFLFLLLANNTTE